MKTLLLLALFSVCNANILWHERPKTNLDLVKDAFWEYYNQVASPAEETLDRIRKSEMGQEVNVWISQSTDTVNHYVAALRSQVAPVTENFMIQFSQQAEVLKATLEKDLATVGDNLRPHAEQLVAQLQTQIEDLKKEASVYAESMDPENLKTIIQQHSQEMKNHLDARAVELQAQMVPYTEEMNRKMKDNLEEFQKVVVPMTQNFGMQLSQKTQEVQQKLATYGEELKAKLDATSQDLQAQLTTLWESFSKKIQ
ncbi:uncharacterized protein ACB057_018924 [Neosynchiropus ocellatus]